MRKVIKDIYIILFKRLDAEFVNQRVQVQVSGMTVGQALAAGIGTPVEPGSYLYSYALIVFDYK